MTIKEPGNWKSDDNKVLVSFDYGISIYFVMEAVLHEQWDPMSTSTSTSIYRVELN